MDLNLILHLLQVRLFNYFQQELPSYWLRYSERVVIEMVTATFSLLSLTYTRPSMLGPVHLVALIDPSAFWLKKWMVSFSTRHNCTDKLVTSACNFYANPNSSTLCVWAESELAPFSPWFQNNVLIHSLTQHVILHYIIMLIPAWAIQQKLCAWSIGEESNYCEFTAFVMCICS